MKEKKTDLRIVKTKKLLYATLLDLMKQKSFEEIKVSDICSLALVNRSTFYSHYDDKYDLFSEYVNDLKNLLAMELDLNKQYVNAKEYYLELITIFLNHIENNKDTYKLILLNNKNSIIMDIVYDVLNEDIKKRINSFGKIKNQNVPLDIVVKFYIGAVFNVGIGYLNEEYNYSKEDIVKYMSVMITSDIPIVM